MPASVKMLFFALILLAVSPVSTVVAQIPCPKGDLLGFFNPATATMVAACVEQGGGEVYRVGNSPEDPSVKVPLASVTTTQWILRGVDDSPQLLVSDNNSKIAYDFSSGDIYVASIRLGVYRMPFGGRKGEAEVISRQPATEIIARQGRVFFVAVDKDGKKNLHMWDITNRYVWLLLESYQVGGDSPDFLGLTYLK